MNHSTHRRWFGFLLGALTGFAFSIVSQVGNLLALPGIPLLQPPFGPAGNILLGASLGGLLGWIAAATDSGVTGVLLGSLAGVLALAAATLLGDRPDPGEMNMRIAGLLIIFMPVMAMLSPALILLRWLANREEEAFRETRTIQAPPLTVRILPPLLLVLVAAALGLTGLYNDLARAVTPRMHALVEQGRAAADAATLPEALQVETVTGFLEHAGQPYTIQWDKDEGNRFAIPRPNTSPFDQSTVIARFADGYLLACVYPSKTHAPRCKDFSPGQPLP